MSIKTITPKELEDIHKQGKKLDLIDVRTPREYQEVHVAFAKNVPLTELDPKSLMAERNDSNTPIYLICRSGGRGRQACEKFIAQGFTNVINVEGGTTACVAEGLTVVRGEAVMSLERQVRIAAGFLVLLGSVFAWFVHPSFIALPAFVGAGLIFAGITDTCGMAMLLARMPWNSCATGAPSCCTGKDKVSENVEGV